MPRDLIAAYSITRLRLDRFQHLVTLWLNQFILGEIAGERERERERVMNSRDFLWCEISYCANIHATRWKSRKTFKFARGPFSLSSRGWRKFYAPVESFISSCSGATFRFFSREQMCSNERRKFSDKNSTFSPESKTKKVPFLS